LGVSLDDEHVHASRDLIKTVGCDKAAAQFNKLFIDGYPENKQPFISDIMASRYVDIGSKRKPSRVLVRV
jgi:TorA maturation chaperone TorD